MSNFSSKQYDVVVCGAGPAGLMAACTLGRLVQKETSGARRVLLLDKKEPWKEPIFCAEAVSSRRLKALWPVDSSFVRGNLSGIYFTSPKRYRAEFYSKDCGYQLNRSALHKNIADECVKAGVECHFDSVVKKLDRTENGWNVVVSSKGVEETLSSTLIIDCSGPGAKLTRGIPCLEGMEDGATDLEPAVFAVAEGIPHSREHIELFFGSEFKDGYGWIFPRDGKEVNIGFVLGKDVRNEGSLRQKLLDFIARDYPGSTVKAVYGGMIACGQSHKPIAKCGLFKAGDSASCVNPISRSGITESLLCGKIVAEGAMEWLQDSGENREAIEARAHQRWMQEMGKSHMQIARGKPGFNKITDEQFDKAALRLSKLPKEKQTLFRIFFNVLWASPSLVWKLRSFLHW
ncbi:Dehydrogenase (flavoprotein) [Fibrobacter sp. UWH9]|uniref:NAD(P)/FAD-dependent oxidoreductase n=1 Tax=Fibrobacter sp. UWH9 TaxID=1896213 RepID=UPI00091FDD66|nr:NAD(P)/FAD-dependent oxidoreductase [Fibrobacter sp. UWH9]SHG81418.1 Dehydrogenase (flavoprotein) [Fibrobacter sp. UWH9]